MSTIAQAYRPAKVQFSLNDDLVNVSNWLIANALTLNITKTEFMLIGSRQRLCTRSAYR